MTTKLAEESKGKAVYLGGCTLLLYFVLEHSLIVEQTLIASRSEDTQMGCQPLSQELEIPLRSI